MEEDRFIETIWKDGRKKRQRSARTKHRHYKNSGRQRGTTENKAKGQKTLTKCHHLYADGRRPNGVIKNKISNEVKYGIS